MFVSNYQRTSEPTTTSGNLNPTIIDTEVDGNGYSTLSKTSHISPTGKSNVRTFKTFGSGLTLLFVAVLWLFVARKCMKLLGTSRGYGNTTLGVQRRRLASGGNEGNSDEEGRRWPLSEEETYSLCAAIASQFEWREQEESSLLARTSRPETTEGVNPQREESGSGSSSQQRSSVLRLKIPGTSEHVIPVRFYTPYLRSSVPRSEGRMVVSPPLPRQSHVVDDEQPGTSGLQQNSEGHRSEGSGSGDMPASALWRPWHSQSFSFKYSPISSEDEDSDAAGASVEEIRKLMQPLPSLLSPLSQEGIRQTQSFFQPRLEAMLKQRALEVFRQQRNPSGGHTSSSDPLEGTSRQAASKKSLQAGKPKKTYRRRIINYGNWQARSLENVPVIEHPENLSHLIKWKITRHNFGAREHAGASKRLANSLYFLLSKPTWKPPDVAEAQRLAISLLHTTMPLNSSPSPLLRGAVAAGRYAQTVYTLDILYRVCELLPNSEKNRWWSEMFEAFGFHRDNFSPRIEQQYLDFIRRCRNAINDYQRGERAFVPEVARIIETFQNQLSSGAPPEEYSAENEEAMQALEHRQDTDSER